MYLDWRNVLGAVGLLRCEGCKCAWCPVLGTWCRSGCSFSSTNPRGNSPSLKVEAMFCDNLLGLRAS